jgi:predicted amidohydrolase YtcJ
MKRPVKVVCPVTWSRGLNMRITPAIVGLLLVVTTDAPAQLTGASIVPHIVYVNGTIVTLDSGNRIAQGVAVIDDRIVAVGSSDAIKAVAGPQTRVVDLGGRTLLPGLYAAHDHFPGSGAEAAGVVDLSSPPVGRMTTMADIIAALKAKAEQTPKGEWIRGRGYDDTLIKEMRHPTRVDLDQASTDHPILIDHISGHLSAANSRALELAGISRDTPQPAGGVIRKDDSGEPDGVFEESGGLVARHAPPPTEEQKWAGYRRAVQDYIEDGVTTIVPAGGGRQSLLDHQAAIAHGLMPIRIVTMLSGSGGRGGDSAEGQSFAESAGLMSGFGNDRLKIAAIKLVADGSLQGYTGYVTKPYHMPFKGDATYRGYPRGSREDLTATVVRLHRAGYQIAIHGNGDASIDDIIFAFRQAQRELPRPDARHRIEHCQTAREDQLDAMKELGITPSFFVGHVYYWGDRHRDIFLGPERGSRISPLRSALDRGIRFTIHDDTPVTPVNPLMLVWDAVNRLTSSGKVLGPDQRIPVEAALRAVTLDAAWQNFEQDRKGSIEPGKLADFVVLSDNPLTIDPVKIRDIKVLETIVGGRTIYSINGVSSSALRGWQ